MGKGALMIITTVMDPPWNEKGGGKSKRGADKHYPTMNKEKIRQVILASPWQPDEGQSVWIWATANFLPDALWLMMNLGAKYVTGTVWVKGEKKISCGECGEYDEENLSWIGHEEIKCFHCGAIKKPRDLVHPQAPGLGQRVRMCHEHLLYGRIGKVPVPPPYNRLPSVFYANRTKHSVKPQEGFDLIAAHDQHEIRQGEKLELFARQPREGWEVWGNEIEAACEGLPCKKCNNSESQNCVCDCHERARKCLHSVY